ncbi:4Fe-4S binding protein [Vibrio genomosp. F10]|uniref:4Fe-4S binding protein n=1 Tax=Vibrio genomosp. F10 TaxID=723171 RepID=UPI0002EC890C|nr:4Fe-4S dicluster domain-containing protein [Vibrio genomosp. F10]OEF05612.1 (Fe-S)-binding protein [Vibrio genomosp. F10 str. 9ZB36]
MLKELLQQATSNNGKARSYAIENTVELTNLIPPTVSYESGGHTLIIGPTDIIQATAKQLSSMASLTLLSTDGENGESNNIYFSSSIEVSGFLGTFHVHISHHGEADLNAGGFRSESKRNLATIAVNQECFDVILDLSLTGIMKEEVPVPGYYPVGRGYPSMQQALSEIPTLMGTFDKPKYFRLDTDLCAHSSRGVKGCDRCVDACPAGALSSIGSDKTGYNIEINPYLCQGVGTCATSCPTEAIRYALPNPEETQQFVERTLENYRKAGGEHPIVLFCSARHEQYTIMALKQLPDNVIPIVVEELPSVGIDTWFAALTNGATQVLFAASQHMPPTIIRVLTKEVAMAQALLAPLGIASDCIEILYLESMHRVKADSGTQQDQTSAVNTLALQTPDRQIPSLQTKVLSPIMGGVSGSKRHRLFESLDTLTRHHQPTENTTPLMESAPYGSVDCESKDCTLCMACVAVCPTRALHHDGESPSLLFIEQDCIQCGMCEKACPESALSLSPRINWDSEQRNKAIVLHHEKPAECLRCSKPFAPQSMITMLQDRLRGHSMFADDVAINRIAMCEDCRVKDVFEAMADDPTKQLTY